MAIDRELTFNGCFGERLLYIPYAAGQTAALMCSKRYHRLAIKVDVIEQCEHNLRIGAPPYRTANKHRIVFTHIRCLALIRRLYTLALLLLSQLGKRFPCSDLL